MARRTTTVTIDDPKSRGHGKSYLVTEMDAEAAEWWAFRIMQALLGGKNGEVVKDLNFNAPLSEFSPMAIKLGLAALSSIPAEQAKPLLDEMMGCVAVKLQGNQSRALLAGDIEDVMTRVQLRKAVLDLHTGFFSNGDESTGL